LIICAKNRNLYPIAGPECTKRGGPWNFPNFKGKIGHFAPNFGESHGFISDKNVSLKI